MAANEATIRLTGDNKSALAAITGVKNGLNGLSNTVDTLNGKMQQLTNAIIGVGILAFTKQLLDSANTLKDLSNATDVSTQNLLEMSTAALGANSNLEGLANMLVKLEGNIGEALAGNLQMQKSLEKVGIGFEEIRTLKPNEIFDKIAVALAKTTDTFTRAKLATELFGKAGKLFNWADYKDNIDALRGTMKEFAGNQERAAQVSERLQAFIALLKIQFLNLLDPILKLLTPVGQMSDTMGTAATVAKILAGAIILIVASTTINLVRSLAGAFSLVAGAMGLGTVAAKAENAVLKTGTELLNARFLQQQAFYLEKVKQLEITVATTRATMAEMQVEIGKARVQAVLTKELKALNTAKVAAASYTAALTAATGVLAVQTVKTTTALMRLTAVATALGGAFLFFVGIVGAPVWATIAAGIAAISAIVLGAIIVWRAFSKELKEFGAAIYKYVVGAFKTALEWIDYAAAGLRKLLGYKPIEIKAVVKTTTTGGEDVKKQIEEDNRVLNQQQTQAQEALQANIARLEAEAPYLRDKIALGETEANITKAIRDEQEKINKANETNKYLKISMSQLDKDRIANSIREKAFAESSLSITQAIKGLDNENYLLSIQDVAQREIQTKLREQIMKYGKFVSDADLASYEASLKKNQALRDEETLRKAIYAASGIPTESMTGQAAAGIGLASDLDPAGKLKAQFALQSTYLIAARNMDKITEENYEKALAALKLKYHQEGLQLEINRYQAVIDNNQREIDAQAAKYAAMIRMQQDYNGQQKYTNQEALDMGKTRAEFEKKTEAQKAQWAIAQIETVTGAVTSQNKTLFRMQQAASIGKAIMNTYEGASKALTQYPPPWSYIAAAAVVAAGMAQVAQIRAQSFSGKAVGGPMVGGQTYLVGEKGPELFTPGQSGSMTANDKMGGGTTNVNFTIVANDTKGFDDLLLTRKNMITRIIADAQLEKGRRQT